MPNGNDVIIIDDGGSTRIMKMMWSDAVGEMDGLLNVEKKSAPGKPYDGCNWSQTRINNSGAAYGRIRVTWLDTQGNANSKSGTFTSFDIVSDAYTVLGEVMSPGDPNAGDLVLTVYGCAELVPVVEAKQQKMKRRYVVSCAPAIDQIKVNGSAFHAVPPKTIYTAVFVT